MSAGLCGASALHVCRVGMARVSFKWNNWPVIDINPIQLEPDCNVVQIQHQIAHQMEVPARLALRAARLHVVPDCQIGHFTRLTSLA